MVLKHMAPIEYAIDAGMYWIVAIIQDDSDEIVCMVDKYNGKYYIEKIFSNYIYPKYSSSNTVKINDDEEFNAYHQFLVDNGLEAILDGARYV